MDIETCYWNIYGASCCYVNTFRGTDVTQRNGPNCPLPFIEWQVSDKALNKNVFHLSGHQQLLPSFSNGNAIKYLRF